MWGSFTVYRILLALQEKGGLATTQLTPEEIEPNEESTQSADGKERNVEWMPVLIFLIRIFASTMLIILHVDFNKFMYTLTIIGLRSIEVISLSYVTRILNEKGQNDWSFSPIFGCRFSYDNF